MRVLTACDIFVKMSQMSQTELNGILNVFVRIKCLTVDPTKTLFLIV